MPRIEGSFAIYAAEDGLLVLVPEAGEPVRYYNNDTDRGWEISQEFEGYLTLRQDGNSDVVHLSRKAGTPLVPISSRKIQ